MLPAPFDRGARVPPGPHTTVLNYTCLFFAHRADNKVFLVNTGAGAQFCFPTESHSCPFKSAFGFFFPTRKCQRPSRLRPAFSPSWTYFVTPREFISPSETTIMSGGGTPIGQLPSHSKRGFQPPCPFPICSTSPAGRPPF